MIRSFGCALALASSTLLAVASAHETFTLRGGRVLQSDGRLEGGLAVVVDGGRIKRFAPADATDLPNPIELDADSVLAPGLLDLASAASAHGETIELSSAVTPELSAVRAVSASHRDLRRALEAGVTAAMVIPAPMNLVAGGAVTMRTAPARPGVTDVLRADDPLVFSVGRGPLRSDREPTSRAGLLHVLRSELAAAKDKGGHARVRLFLDSKLAGLAFCDDPADVRAALDTFGDAGRVPAIAIRGTGTLADGIALASRLAELDRPVLLGPYDFKTPEADLLLAGELARRGVSVAFAGGLPAHSRHSPRITAALAARHGMDAKAARVALTANASILAGVSDRLGAIAPGKDADLVVFSGDPLRLDSRVLRVWVRGETVFVNWRKER